MDYEKKYKEALERAKYYREGIPDRKLENGENILDYIFPELKESEDERIRREMIEIIKNEAHEFPSSVIANKSNSWIAWLEKQGEQKEKEYITITQKILDYIGKYESSFENGIPKLGDSWKVIKISKYPGVNGGKPVAKVVNEDNGDWMRLPLNIVDIKIEQNPADDVKPKFKVGDWIIKNDDSSINIDYSCCKITKVENGNYTIESIYGYKGYNTFGTFEKDYHLWTIEDAKDGDVLRGYPTDDYPWIGIFHELNDDYTFKSYCFLQAGITGKFCPPSGANIFNRRNVDGHNSKVMVPATKEERDFLFKKMKEAGYEWNAEKKELKKIEKKPAWSEEDEKMISKLIKHFDWKNTGYRFFKEDCLEATNWLKSLKPHPKQEWSEEDERNLRGIICEIEINKFNAPEYDMETYDGFLSWLKSLKDRV